MYVFIIYIDKSITFTGLNYLQISARIEIPRWMLHSNSLYDQQFYLFCQTRFLWNDKTSNSFTNKMHSYLIYWLNLIFTFNNNSKQIFAPIVNKDIKLPRFYSHISVIKIKILLLPSSYFWQIGQWQNQGTV